MSELDIACKPKASGRPKLQIKKSKVIQGVTAKRDTSEKTIVAKRPFSECATCTCVYLVLPH